MTPDHESSKSDDWLTPLRVVRCLDEIGIDLDPCSHPYSIVGARKSYDIRDGWDGLNSKWRGTTFVNPPYSQLAAWLMKACKPCGEKSCRGDGQVWSGGINGGFSECTCARTSVITLCPARLETRAFFTHVYRASGVAMLAVEGRLRYLVPVEAVRGKRGYEKRVAEADADGLPIVEGDSCPHASVIIVHRHTPRIIKALSPLGEWLFQR